MSDDDENRQPIVIVGRLKGHTIIDDRIIYIVNVRSYTWDELLLPADDGGD